ncbi:methyl-accepting chemotaxis protein [Burkholderia anthina]|uniref:methyl-accepting chemotaxis protein n=1 Tax=Burkholderia anthina TaxID=179879 RepID=UPI001CF3E17D|nr:methyl-accepting chemotaxis protein [Burkholderia anthina]MCA8095386.1 methyl-accepting chemotaxis protein [Burkholderia anthina]
MNKVITIRLRLLFAFGSCAILTVTSASLAAIELFGRNISGTRSDFLLSGVIFACAVGTAMSLWATVHLQRVVCGGLIRMRRNFEEITRTLDLSQRSASPRMDEFGRGALAFDKLMHRFEGTVSSVRLSADTVARAAGEIAAGNLELSARTEEQAASLQETASSMTQIAQTVRQNAESSREATMLVGQATEVSAAGSNMVVAMGDTMRCISESSNRISQITGLIEELAFQTNILALNAAVEAVRAGEQGKGFAVVAGEVRSLAQRSAAAAKEIKEVISASVAGIALGSQHMADVSQVMDGIRTAVGRVSGIMEEIAGASAEQRHGIDQVSRVIVQMDSVTQQNAALVEQAAAAAESLDDQAHRLKAEVALFTFAPDQASVG